MSIGGFQDGYFAHGMLVYGTPVSRASVVAKGCVIDITDISAFSDSRLGMFRAAMQGALSLFVEGEAMQFQWSVASDYERELDYYDGITETGFKGNGTVSDWSRLNRDLISDRFRDDMDAGDLRRERIVLWFTQRCSTLPKGRLTASIVDTFLRTAATALDERIASFRSLLADGSVQPMDDEDNYLYLLKFFNRDLVTMDDAKLLCGFDPAASIAENCIQSDGGTVKLDDGTVAFRFDGRYQAQFVLRRWPTMTHPLVLRSILSACNRDVAVTVNVAPLDIEKEINKEDRQINRMRRVNADPKSYNASVESAIHKREHKVMSLSSGDVVPLSAMYVVRIWADSLDELRERAVAVRTAISVSGGAKHHEVTLDAQARNIFFSTFPGWTGAHMGDWRLYAENDYFADLLPMQVSFTGKSEPEALYYGQSDNIGGIRLFTSGTPHHAFVCGVTRSGKSVLMIDLLTQTDPFFGFTAIVEEGLSYGTYTQLMGGEPIIISTDSPYTFNVFDTMGLPLTAGHINAAVALLSTMIGRSGTPDVDRRRSAMISEYIQRLYDDVEAGWCQLNPSEEIRRDALATYRWFKEKMPLGSEYIEAFLECKRMESEEKDKWREWRAAPSKDDVNGFALDPATRRICRDYTFSVFMPEDFSECTLNAIVQGIEYAKLEKHDEEEANLLATMLAGWTADRGSYGAFFDGISNFKPTGKIIHFELGQIAKGASALKECVGFLISHWVRQYIIGLPRGIRKRVVFEEIARFFDIPGGDDIIQEFAAQLGKHACWLCSITQVFAQIKHMPLAQKLIGNCSLFFLLKQKDPADLRDLAKMIDIPESAQETILNYTIPANQPASRRASYFTVLQDGENGTICGNLKCIATKPLIYSASSTGDEWESRRRALARYDSPFYGVLAETDSLHLLDNLKS